MLPVVLCVSCSERLTAHVHSMYCMYVYVCVCIYVRMCMYVYVYTYVYVCVCIYICACMCIRPVESQYYNKSLGIMKVLH